jgi:hypothetical protein
METEHPMTEKDSLLVIQQMITATKKGINEDGYLYLLWGWLALFASLGHYVLMTFTDFKYPFITWMSMPVAGVIAGIYFSSRAKKRRVKTYVDEFMSYLWGGLLVSIMLLLLVMPKVGMEKVYPVLILFYGIGTFASGGALRFRPLIIGGALNWPIALAAFFVPFSQQLLLLGLAVICSYIVPGYLLRANFKRQNV